ncbi:MAG: M23 family metallopeptidase, partial [Coxiellaceae bacterium]|nr:M23 family metallopeptidase [Coxiellaceae bacterium]
KYPIDGERTLYIYTDQTKYKELLANKPLSKHILFKSVKIKSNFKHAVKAAGLTHQQIDQLETIFEGEINFAHDVHSGDQFSLLYNEYYWHGKKVKPGEILAAEFTHHGKTYKAIRFTYPRNHTGYYMPNGSGVEPLFLKRPLHYKRISGKFSLRRFDPFLKIVHPHLGVDFAAKYGTPIKSIGAGKVIFHGWKGGYGKAVIVRYNRKYKALYGHMSRYAKGIRNGMIVKKGQVIGYVGSTGWATGPHLHFEIYVYGIPHNPLKMKFVGGKSVPKAYLSSFHKEADAMLNDLKRYQGRGFAVVDNNQK